MSTAAYLALIAVILCIVFRILNVNNTAQKCQIFCKDTDFLFSVRKVANIIDEPYIPTRLWGFSGHIQTILHSVIGRVRCPWPISERVSLHLRDGSTVTYDLYQPITTLFDEDDITMAICPGIGNTSESVYIRTFVHFAQCHGYRCAVLNHVGALKSVPITSSRIFNYGETGDFSQMLKNLTERHYDTKIVCIGFSLGGNIVTKYLGEKNKNRCPKIIGAISICQGYCALGGIRYLLGWQNFRRFYLYIMTESMKSIILRHRSKLLSGPIIQKYNINERDIITAKTLYELDDSYTRKVNNFSSVNELYKWSSCINYLNSIETPMIFINAKDDPIVPEELLTPVQNLAQTKEKTMFLEFKHGGHLGFFEGGLVYPNPITFLDRALVALVGGLVLFSHENVKSSAFTLQK